MKLKLFILTFFICTISFAQSKGTVTGVLTDKESNNETLPFANVLLKEQRQIQLQILTENTR